MADPGKFQEQIRRLSELVTDFEHMADSPQKAKGSELVQLLMEVHAQGLERMMEVVFESREGGNPLVAQLGNDEVTGALLLLYSLHPDSLETRVNTAVERMRPRLRKLECAIDEVTIDQESVRLHLASSGHSCGSSKGELRALVESGIYELAPDVTSLEILGLEENPRLDLWRSKAWWGKPRGNSFMQGSQSER